MDFPTWTPSANSRNITTVYAVFPHARVDMSSIVHVPGRGGAGRPPLTPGFENTAVVFVDVAGDILPLQDVRIVVVPGVKTMLSFEIVLHLARMMFLIMNSFRRCDTAMVFGGALAWRKRYLLVQYNIDRLQMSTVTSWLIL